MYVLNKHSRSYLLGIFVLLFASAIVSKSYVISLLFFLCTLISLMITKSDNLYESLYYTLLVSAIFEYTAYFPKVEKLYFFHILLGIVTIYTLLRAYKAKDIFKSINKKVIYFYLIWFMYICLSFLWSKNKSFNIKYIIIYSMMFIFLFIIIKFNNTRQKLVQTLKVTGSMFAVSVIIGIIEAVTAVQLPVKHYYNFTVYKLSVDQLEFLRSRPIAFSYNSNNFAALISICIPFLFFLFFYVKSRKVKIAIYILTALSMTVLLLTTSRSVMMAVILSIGLYTIFLIKEKGIKAWIYPLIIIVSFVLLYNYSYFIIKNNMEYLKAKQEKMSNIAKMYNKDVEIGEEGSENERATIMYDVYEGIIKEHRILGFGAGNTTQYLMDRGNTHGIYSTHGLIIEILGDFGLPIFILYGLFYIYLLFSLIRISTYKDETDKMIAFSLFTALLSYGLASFAPSSVTYFLPNWIFFGIVISFIQTSGNRIERQ